MTLAPSDPEHKGPAVITLPNNVTVHTDARGIATVRYWGNAIGQVWQEHGSWYGHNLAATVRTPYGSKTRAEAVKALWSAIHSS